MRLVTVGIVVSLCLATDVFGYCLEVQPNSTPSFLAWTPLPANYRISDNLTDSNVLAAIDAAFTAWGSVPCSRLKFSSGDPFSLSAVPFTHDQKYLFIFWYTTPWDGFKNPSPAQPSMSKTFIYYTLTGGIAGASIALNAVDYKWNATGGSSDTFDVQNELMHLIGSVSGLNYTPDPGHVMSNGFKYGDTSRRTLSQDDKDALVYLYKAEGCADPPQPNPSTGCSSGSGPNLDGGGATGDGTIGPTTDGGGAGTADKGGATLKDGSTGKTDGGGGSKLCTSNAACAEGEECTAQGVCAQKEKGGCGCDVGRGTEGQVISFLLLCIGLGSMPRVNQKRRRKVSDSNL